MTNTVKNKWEEYSRTEVANNEELSEEDCERSFYAGAICAFNIIDYVFNTYADEDQADEAIDTLSQELQDFVNKIKFEESKISPIVH